MCTKLSVILCFNCFNVHIIQFITEVMTFYYSSINMFPLVY